MKYNFDEIVDRSRNRSAKYDEAGKKFGSQDVIPLWIADMDFKTAQPVIDALKARAEEGIWGYTSRPDSYYEAVCGWQKRRNGWDIDKSMISFNLGVVPALSSMVYVFTEPGDKVLIQTPVYSEFYDVTESWGREVVESPLKEQDGRWAIDFEDFEEKAKEAKIFFLCSPHNPLGIVWTREELERMCNICIANNVLIVSDEIHSDLVFHGKKHIPTATLSPEIATHVISCISGTKTFNLAGLQASATIFPNQKLKARFDKFWFNLDIHRNNAFSTIAMEVAFNEGEEWLEQLKDYLDGNFAYIDEYLKKYLPKAHLVKAEGTYLAWLDLNGYVDRDEKKLEELMQKKAKVALDEGYIFGEEGRGFERINVASPRSVIEECMNRIRTAFEEEKLV